MASIIAGGCGGNTSTPESTVQWIDLNEVQQGPTLHDKLPDELLSRIKTVHKTFADVDVTPLEEWIDDFKRDLDPEGNVKIWEDMQVAYNAYCDVRELPLATRKEVFKIVLMRSTMPDNDVLARIKLEHIGKPRVRILRCLSPAIGAGANRCSVDYGGLTILRA